MTDKPEFKVVPAIFPGLVKPCAYCGEDIRPYTKVIVLRTPGFMTETTQRDLLLHPDCLMPFAHWIGEIAARV